MILETGPVEKISTRAAEMLMKQDWDDAHKLVGGFDAYLEAGLPVEPVTRAVPATRIMWL